VDELANRLAIYFGIFKGEYREDGPDYVRVKDKPEVTLVPVKSPYRQVRAFRRVQVAGNPGGLNRSVQHSLAVYSPAFQSPRSFADVD
jgi:hypothetical protein